MSIPRYLLSSTALSGAVFCAATIPMATLDSKPVTIQVDDDPVFVGQMKELAAPYLSLATAVSLGMGVMTLTMLGWSRSSSKLSQTKDEMVKLQKELQERDALVEQLKFSDARLEASGLSSFIDEEPETERAYAPNQAVIAPSMPQPREIVPSAQHQTAQRQPYHVSTVAPVDRAIALPQPSRRQPAKQAAAAMPSAQVMNGFVRPSAMASRQDRSSAATAPSSEHDATQLNELLSNLKQVMAQVEKLHQVDAVNTPISSPAA